jgi:hypothetical protein
MENTVVQDGCRALLAATEPWIKTVSTIEFKGLEKSVFLRAVLTAIVVKQFELVTVILEQSETERGFASVPLLRSMCEELMWIRFLASLDSEDAADMIVEMANVGLDETYKAQEGYVVPNLVFPPAWVAGTKLAAEAARVALRSKFKKLGFSLRSNQYLPKLFQIAKRVDMEAQYKLLYHATSRAVHFSVPELLRRVWGRPGEFHVSSDHWERYWSKFSLYWGSWLYSLTFIEIAIHLGARDLPTHYVDELSAAMELVKSDGAMPIITPEEVFWPEPSH